MKVIDLIIALQQLPPNMDVMIDRTKDGSGIFKAEGVAWVDEIEAATGDRFVFISSQEYDEPSEN